MYSLVKDNLVLIQYLGTHDIALSSFASAQMNYDLVIWLMEYATNIKR
jgi:hypothetical protein